MPTRLIESRVDHHGEPLPEGVYHLEARVGRVRLGAVAADPGIVVRIHDELHDARLAPSARRASLSLLRTVLNWGRRRYPRVLTTDLSGLFSIPRARSGRLRRATDPIGVEQIIEAVLNRAHRDPLGPVRDAALVAAMGFTVAARPSEWLVSATWGDVREQTVELQAVLNALGEESDAEVGLKTGARAALHVWLRRIVSACEHVFDGMQPTGCL